MKRGNYMNRVKGIDIEFIRREGKPIISGEWVCPCCNEFNYLFTMSARLVDLNKYEVECECEYCEEVIMVECLDIEDE